MAVLVASKVRSAPVTSSSFLARRETHAAMKVGSYYVLPGLLTKGQCL